MSLGEMLHRLGSAIGLYPEDRSSEDYDDYEEPYAEDDYAQDEPYRASARSAGYRSQTSSSSRAPKSAPRPAYSSASGSGYSSGGTSSSSGAYDSPQPKRSTIDNVVQMPLRNNSGTVGRDNVYGSSSQSSGAYGAASSASSSRHSEIIVYVRRKDDAQQIIGYVLEERSVILNCESIDDAQCQRVIDMLGGAAYAIGGHVQRVSHRNYLFAPANVEVSSSDSAPVSRYGANVSAAQS